MGRRDAETAGRIDQVPAEASAKGWDTKASAKAWDKKAWEAVRRALGRLIGHVAVHDCGPSARTIDVCVVASDAVSAPDVPLGRADWQPAATVRLAVVPSAGTGLRERSFLPTAALAHGDYALRPSAVCEMPVVQAEAGHVESAGLVWSCETTPLPPESLYLTSGPLQINNLPLPVPPGANRLTAWDIQEPSVRAMRLPRLDSPRVRLGGDDLIGRMALTRRARAATDERAYITAQRRLAESSYLPLEDVALLGIYPGIPILAVSRIVVEGEGRVLRFWLKPEVLRARAAAHLITLLVGRQSSTGKMLQTAL